MKLRKQIGWVLYDMLILFRRHKGSSRAELARRFLAGHLRLGMYRNNPAPGCARLFEFDVSYFSEEAYLTLVHEIFIDSQYDVQLESASPMIVDGGANIGVSVLWWKHFYPKARVLAFEPDPDTFAMLRRNVDGNHLTDVEIVNRALSDREADVTLFHDATLPGNLSMTTAPNSRLLDQRSVKTTTLSSYLSGRVDLLKLDVEGCEQEIIRELAATGKLTLVDQIVMEYHHHQQSDVDRLGEMLTIFEAHGFGYQLGGAANMVFRRGDVNPLLLYAYKKRPAE